MPRAKMAQKGLPLRDKTLTIDAYFRTPDCNLVFNKICNIKSHMRRKFNFEKKTPKFRGEKP